MSEFWEKHPAVRAYWLENPIDAAIYSVDAALTDLAEAVGVLKHGGSHDDLDLTCADRLDLFRQAEDIYNPPSVPVIPGREEN